MRLDSVEALVQVTLEEELDAVTEEELTSSEEAAATEMHVQGTLEEKDERKEVPKLELKTLPPTLKYAYLGENRSYLVIINSALSQEQEERLLQVLQKHRDAIGGTLADLKGISSAICMYKILLEEDAKPSIQPQRRLNPVMKEEFNIEIRDKKGVENKVADHLSRIPCEKNDTHDTSVNESFPDEQLMMVHKAPWFADIANFKVASDLPPGINKYQRRKLINDAKYFIWDEPYLFKKCSDRILRRCISEEEGREVLWSCHSASFGGHFGGERTAVKVLQCEFFWPTIFKDAKKLVRSCNECQRAGNLPKRNEMPQQYILELELFDVWGINFMGPFLPSYSKKYILVAVDYVSK
ncbi:uncharacterized protein [Arachis hypogaea]|uniref:uncharacterized protein n=1 Tax=Arachis hypogaea TaxID=3818 RepID=UPI003B20FE74